MEKQMQSQNGFVASLTITLLLFLLSNCDYIGDTVVSNTEVDTTVNGTTTATSTSTSTRRAVATPTAIPTHNNATAYIDDNFDGSCTECQLHNAAYLQEGGIIILEPSDAYIQYHLPTQKALSVQMTFSGASETNGEKRVLFHLTDSMDAWVGDNHVWADSSLIEVRYVDGRLRFRVGGDGQEEFPTEYVYDGLDAGTHTMTVTVIDSTASLSLDGITLTTFDATTFNPCQLYLFIGGGVLNESSMNVIIHHVAVSF